MSESPGQITNLLIAAHAGTPGAFDELIGLVYHQLRQIAGTQRVLRGQDHFLKKTALVHEAYIRLFTRDMETWENRSCFFWAASRAMHDILVEEARRICAQKRGGGRKFAAITEDVAVQQREESKELISFDEALTQLREVAPGSADVVMLRFFGGLSHRETAEMLGIAHSTVRTRWIFARAWLHRYLTEKKPGLDGTEANTSIGILRLIR